MSSTEVVRYNGRNRFGTELHNEYGIPCLHGYGVVGNTYWDTVTVPLQKGDVYAFL